MVTKNTILSLKREDYEAVLAKFPDARQSIVLAAQLLEDETVSSSTEIRSPAEKDSGKKTEESGKKKEDSTKKKVDQEKGEKGEKTQKGKEKAKDKEKSSKSKPQEDEDPEWLSRFELLMDESGQASKEDLVNACKAIMDLLNETD